MNDNSLYKPIAISIGNCNYENCHKLPNDRNDATEIKNVLEEMGYDTNILVDKSKQEIEQELDSICSGEHAYNAIVFYYSGHGIEMDGKNYLPCINLPELTSANYKSAIPEYSICLDELVDKFDKAGFYVKVIILDACRSNPTKSGLTDEYNFTKFAPIKKTSKGTLLAFATTSGTTASPHGIISQNSLYTESLLKHITEPISIEECFKKVREDVYVNSSRKQLPWEHTALTTYYSFNYKKISIDKEVYQIDLTVPQIGNEENPSITKQYKYEVDAYFDSTGSTVDEIIVGLRSHQWNLQNDAMNKLTSLMPADVDDEHQFLLGRNILQSAIGGAFSAVALFGRLQNWLLKWSAETGENHILNGILYEIYFDKTATLRDTRHFKAKYVDNIFELVENEKLLSSFDFISSKLSRYSNILYFVPSRAMQKIIVDVYFKYTERTILEKYKESYYEIEEILLDGVNIASTKEYFRKKIEYDDFCSALKNQLCVDKSHIDIKINDINARKSLIEVREPLIVQK